MACTPERSAEIGELVGGRLGAVDASVLLEHVEACTACSEELDLVADLLHAPLAAARSGRLVRHWRAGLVALAAAAAVLLLFLLRDEPERRLCDLAWLAPPPGAELVLRGGVGAQPDAAMEQAIERFAAGDHAQAAEGFRAFLETHPDEPLVLFYLGIALLQRREFDAAIDALRRAEELGTSLLAEQALWYRAQAHLARDDGAEAHALLRRLVELDGDYEPNARALLDELEPLLSR